MTVLAAARCVNCGRDVRGLPDTRKEGKLHYCSQSCYLQHESRLARGLAAPPRPNRASFRPGGVRSPLRVAWKAVKVLVILVVLAVTAFVIAVVVAVTKACKGRRQRSTGSNHASTVPAREGRNVTAPSTSSPRQSDEHDPTRPPTLLALRQAQFLRRLVQRLFPAWRGR